MADLGGPASPAAALLAWLGLCLLGTAATARTEEPRLRFRDDAGLAASPLLATASEHRRQRPRRKWEQARYTRNDVHCEGKHPVICTLPRALMPLRPRPRLAVVVVGLIDRFYPHGVLRRVVAPAARDGFDVDYCVIMVLQSNRDPRLQNSSWAERISGRTSTWNAGWLHPASNPAWAGIGPSMLRDQLIWGAVRNNASRLILFTLQRDLLLHPLPLPEESKRWFGHPAPHDPKFFWRKGSFKLSLRRFMKIDHLWERIPGAMDGIYHQVIMTRDDVQPLADIDMSQFPDAAAIYSRAWGAWCQLNRQNLHRPNDHMIVVGGIPARWFMRPYWNYWINEDPRLDTAATVEDFLKIVATSNGARWEMVTDDALPFQLVMHIRYPGLANPLQCLRGGHHAGYASGDCAATFPPGVFWRDCYNLLAAEGA